MTRSSFVLLLGAALLSSAGCARTEAVPGAGAGATASAAGDVKPTSSTSAGMSGLTDSVSAAADRGRIRGSADAPVWLIEVSDFQCPFCKQWHDASFAALDSEYVRTGKARMAYLNFPLTSIHPNAQAAAEAAMCASVQGKFWQMHESLFATQQRWEGQSDPMPTFDSLAVANGVEPKAWRDCMTSHATARLIEADRDRSRGAGVGSTPTFFIGDRKLEGAYPTDSFRVALDKAIAAAKSH
ncbi:MAG TPA: thioredoxin domain-containing protein [Gemmatimonadaceae bacterium]